jgi:N-acetyl-1-D-myo-inositol-2-amino-2-deoxy-alpha-D-glucopyranoside deacetylase
MTDRRMLLVHAHPDDETLGNGATMAKYAAEGAQVTLLTCTRGEEGLVLVPELEHMAAHRDDRLGEHREGELAAAMAELGVADHRFLDTVALPEDGVEEGRPFYRDSGMAWDEQRRAVPAPDTGPHAFSRVDVDAAAARAAAVIRELKPQVLLTYEPGGGYGHPDHVQAHRVAMRAAELAADDGPGGPGWRIPKIYWNALPEGIVRAALRELADTEGAPPGWDPDGPLPTMMIPDDLVTTAVDATPYLDHKIAALKAHATQVVVEGETVMVGDGVRQPVVGVEFYRLVQGTAGVPRDADGRETDLFAGLDGR